MEFASGKDAEFQPERKAMRSPGVGDAGRAVLAARGTLPVVEGKHACHSDVVPDAETARKVQQDAGTGAL